MKLTKAQRLKAYKAMLTEFSRDGRSWYRDSNTQLGFCLAFKKYLISEKIITQSEAIILEIDLLLDDRNTTGLIGWLPELMLFSSRATFWFDTVYTGPDFTRCNVLLFCIEILKHEDIKENR